MTRVTTFEYNGKKWDIVLHNGYFCAIPSEYIRNGKLTKQLNGIQMHANESLEGCIYCIRASEDIKNLADTNNISLDLATRQYFGLFD